MSKKLISLFVILLSIIVILQSYCIYHKTYSGYMFNPKYKMERINIDYVVLSYNLLTIKGMIQDSDDIVMSVFIRDIDKKYNVELQYWFNKRNFYPITMPREHNRLPYQLLEYTDEVFGESLIKNKNDYIVLVGKNSSILNVTTQKDISLYKVISQTELKLVYDFDNTLYSLQENSKKFNENEYFEETMKLINNYIRNYSNDYGMSAYEYIYDYANDLKKNGDIEAALNYYNIYLDVRSLEPQVLLNKASIYQAIGDYDNANFMIESCKNYENCDLQIANEIENNLEG